MFDNWAACQNELEKGIRNENTYLKCIKWTKMALIAWTLLFSNLPKKGCLMCTNVCEKKQKKKQPQTGKRESNKGAGSNKWDGHSCCTDKIPKVK